MTSNSINTCSIESADGPVGVVCEQHGGECQMSLAGRITIESSPDLRKLLFRQVESPLCRILTVDLCAVDYIDTSGLAVLVEALKAARMRGKTLRLGRLGERPRFLLEATRLLHFFEDVKGQDPMPQNPKLNENAQ